MAEQESLLDWMKARGVSQRELGARVGCSDVHVGRICNEPDPPISFDLAMRIFKETGIKIGPLKQAAEALSGNGTEFDGEAAQ